MNKKLFLSLLVFLILVKTVIAFSGSGSGTMADPFVITNCTQLQETNLSISANYTLGNNIDCSDTINWNNGQGFYPIAVTYNGRFLGSFNGRGYNITSLYINRATSIEGLFGYTGTSANITNFGVLDAVYNGTSYLGGIVAYNYGSVSYIYFRGNITGTSGEIGGIVGVNDGPISYSHSKGVFIATTSGMIGGVIGDSIDYKSIISNSYAEGSVSGVGQGVGGFAGRSYGTISNSFSLANVTSTSTGIGGFVGTNYGSISYSYSMGKVTGSNPYYTCGFGDTSGSISGCYHDSQTGLAYYAGSYCSRTEKTTSQMLTQSTYSGWNFTGIWLMSGNRTEGYPYLSSLGGPASGISINVIYPINNGNYSRIASINYSVSSAGTLDRCWYSNSSGIWNSSTVAAGTSFTDIAFSGGQNNFIVYCNSSTNLASRSFTFNIKQILLEMISPLGNMNAAQNRTFEVKVNVTCLQANCGVINVSLDPTSNLITNGDFELGTLSGWTTGGNANWAAQSTTKVEGTYAGKAGTITDSQNTWIYQNVTLSSATNLTFNWKVSSEGSWDYLGFCMDKSFGDTGCTRGVGNITSISGTVDWTAVRVLVPTGTHKLLWYYAKDGSAASGSDTGWLDNVTLLGTTGKGLILMSPSATPFNTATQNPYNLSLNQGESQVITWVVNATGTLWSNHTFFVYANLTSDFSVSNLTQTWNVSIVNFTSDNTAPSIRILYPENNTNTNFNISTMNYSASDDVSIDRCWYSLNGGQTNSTTQVIGINFTNLVSSDGWNTWRVYCNDSSGNIGTNLTSFFKDSISPEFALVENQTIEYNHQLGYQINANDSSGLSCFSVNDTTNFRINCSGYLENLGSLLIGLYLLNISVNDSLNNIKSVLILINATISEAPNSILNSPSENYLNNSAHSENITFNCLATDSFNLSNISLYLTNSSNQNFILNQTSSLTGVSNSSYWTLGLAEGVYTWNCLVYDSDSNLDWAENRSLIINFSDMDGDNISDVMDKLIGNESNVIVSGNISNLNITVGGAPASGSFEDVQEIVFFDFNETILNFSHNFTDGELDLTKIYIVKDENYLIINLSGQLQQNFNKTIYLRDNNFIELCVKDAEVASISEVTNDCNGANETSFNSCLGNSTGVTINGLTCSDEGSIIRVDNLRYSVIVGKVRTPTILAINSNSGGGSSGSGYECTQDKNCKLGYSCYNHRCVKLFDVEILEIEPVINNLSFRLKYLVKGMAEIKGDVIIKFWINNKNEKIMLGQDAIYLGSFEEKTKVTSLNLPLNIENKDYELYVQVNFENYSVESFRKINLNLPESIKLIEETKNRFFFKLIKSLTYFSGIILMTILALICFFTLLRKIKSVFKNSKIELESPIEPIKFIRLQEENKEIRKMSLKVNKENKKVITSNEFIPKKIKLVKGFAYLSNFSGREIYTSDGNKIGVIDEPVVFDYKIYGWKIKLDKKYDFNKTILIRQEYIQAIGDIILLKIDFDKFLNSFENL
jgi:sporulation protein YlmC with PRC-barrel domain